jgi:GT2 family glycosyltransferase
VNYNSGARLAQCLAHLKAQTFQNFETIVVDNASADESAAAARGDEKVALIDAGANLGFAAANNLAARRAQGEWLAFLNPDAYAAPDWLEELLAAAARWPDADAFGSTQIDAKDPSRLDGAGDVFHAFGVPYRGHVGWLVAALPPEGECFAPCGAAAFYRKEAFERLGGFDERFFCYSEDVDLGFRLRLYGGMAVQAPKAVVRHEGSGITGRHSDFTVYHGHRNRVWTYALNMPAPLLALTLAFHLIVNLYLLARFTVSGGAGAYLRAMRDAAQGLPALWPDRRTRQRERTASVSDIARALTWSPGKVMRKEADIRPRRKPPHTD